jgi:hypothetical protein
LRRGDDFRLELVAGMGRVMANLVGERLDRARSTQDNGAPKLAGGHGLRRWLAPDLRAPLRAGVLVFAASVSLAPGGIANPVEPALPAAALPAPDGQAFLAALRAAAAQPNLQALTDLVALPFLFEGRTLDRSMFALEAAPAMFTPAVRRCLARAVPRADADRWVLWCRPYAFYLGPVRGRWRLIEFGADGEE